MDVIKVLIWLLKNFVKFERSVKKIGTKISWRDYGLRDIGSVFMFDDDSELRCILRLTPGSVPESLRSFWNVWFSMELGVRSSISKKCSFVRTIVWGHGCHRWTSIAKIWSLSIILTQFGDWEFSAQLVTRESAQKSAVLQNLEFSETGFWSAKYAKFQVR